MGDVTQETPPPERRAALPPARNRCHGALPQKDRPQEDASWRSRCPQQVGELFGHLRARQSVPGRGCRLPVLCQALSRQRWRAWRQKGELPELRVFSVKACPLCPSVATPHPYPLAPGRTLAVASSEPSPPGGATELLAGDGHLTAQVLLRAEPSGPRLRGSGGDTPGRGQGHVMGQPDYHRIQKRRPRGQGRVTQSLRGFWKRP